MPPTVRVIQTLGAPVLRQVARTVPSNMFNTPELKCIIDDMIDTMKAANGAGIAAPQIGESWRIFLVHGSGSNPRYPYKPAIPLTVFINPVIEVLEDGHTPMHMIEGCLSVPGMRGKVSRASRVRCTGRVGVGCELQLMLWHYVCMYSCSTASRREYIRVAGGGPRSRNSAARARPPRYDMMTWLHALSALSRLYL